MSDDDYVQAVHGLLRKRGELSALAADLRGRLDECLVSMAAVERAIRVFRPDADMGDLPERPAPPMIPALRGEVRRFIMDELRVAPVPLTTTALAEASIRKRGLDPSDRVIRVVVRKRIAKALVKLKSEGLVTGTAEQHTRQFHWEIKKV